MQQGQPGVKKRDGLHTTRAHKRGVSDWKMSGTFKWLEREGVFCRRMDYLAVSNSHTYGRVERIKCATSGGEPWYHSTVIWYCRENVACCAGRRLFEKTHFPRICAAIIVGVSIL
jgi:hypothetical protein